MGQQPAPGGSGGPGAGDALAAAPAAELADRATLHGAARARTRGQPRASAAWGEGAAKRADTRRPDELSPFT